MKKILEVGDSAPDFDIPNQNGDIINLKNFENKWSVIYFYPRDDTPGCTIEAKEFTDLNKQFEKLGCSIVGVSPDNEAKHCKFIDKYDLKIDLLADTEKTMLDDYGVWQEKSMYGKTYMGVVRTTYLINPDGNIAEAWTKVKAKGHAEAVLERLIELKG
ncbi:MAG: thioredoxin-dependent thiol peroxidase [Methanobacteriota archaeon]|jgi:peroxiredoxin Q/BCP|uniref:thioredoxin-dependent peroxiredoxin n=1 Tax=Marine Group III euryarchaeote TaxID=2173149 RepID=A0A7J4GTH2_9ARCH|nr:MAG: thioredoxin-dependent thiol peroxidase [Euryarchaeota archaeon]HIF37104.1 thioredoxin-dependent thiol peroxidase [Marine Group III euryarchaeote]